MHPRVLLFTTLFAGSLAAQQPQTTAPPDQDTSLAARLERAERLLELLREQVSQQAKARVEPRSGNHIELSGLVLVNGFFNNARVNNSDVPQVVLPPDPALTLPVSHGGATARQSQIALTAVVPELSGGSFHGELDVDFFGGQQPSAGGRTWPLVRLRRLRAQIQWPHGWVMFGQEAPPIAEINPSSLAQIGLVGFARSGNLWLWLPQVRAGAEVGTTVKIGIEGSALAPAAGDPQGVGVLFTQPDRAERTGRPNLEGRLRIRWDEAESSGEISLGGHYGWLTKTADTLIASRAVAASCSPARRWPALAEEGSGRTWAWGSSRCGPRADGPSSTSGRIPLWRWAAATGSTIRTTPIWIPRPRCYGTSRGKVISSGDRRRWSWAWSSGGSKQRTGQRSAPCSRITSTSPPDSSFDPTGQASTVFGTATARESLADLGGSRYLSLQNRLMSPPPA